MLPTKIIISAFGSYSDEAEIDMSALGENGVYLITGETGAGKTTIFDAVTFALYDNASGSKNKNLLRCQSAKPNVNTYVDLYFDHKGKHYRVLRGLPRKNEKNRTIKGTDMLQVYLIDEAGTEICINENKKAGDTNDLIVSILGVDYNQFRQIVMLSQGDFFRLVEAKSNERKAIFSKIFDTGIYSRAEIAAKNEFSDASNRITQRCTEQRVNINAIAENDAHSKELAELRKTISRTEGTKDVLLTAADSECAIELTGKIISEDKALLCKLNDENEKRKKLIFDLESRIKAAENAEKLRAELKAHTEEKQALSQKIAVLQRSLEEAQRYQEDIGRLRKNADIVELSLSKYAELEEKQHKLNENSKLFEKLCREHKKAEETLSSLYESRTANDKRLSQLQNVDSDYAAANAAFEAAKSREGSVEELKATQNKVMSANAALLAARTTFIDDENRSLNAQRNVLITAYAAKNGCETRLAECSENEKRCAAEILECEEKLSELKDAPAQKPIVEMQLKRILDEGNAIKELMDVRLKSFRKLKKEQSEHYIKLKALRDKKDSSEQIYNSLNDAYHKNAVWQIASELKENEPCPVCGSVHHPNIAPKPDGAPSKAEVDSAKANFVKLCDEYESLSEKQDSLDKKAESQLAVIAEQGRRIIGETFTAENAQELLGSRRTALRTEYSEADSELKSINKKIEQAELISKNIKKLREQLADNSRLANRLFAELSEKKSLVSQLEGELKTLISELPEQCRRSGVVYESNLFDEHIPTEIFDERNVTDKELSSDREKAAQRRIEAARSLRAAEKLRDSLSEITAAFNEQLRRHFKTDSKSVSSDLIENEYSRCKAELNSAKNTVHNIKQLVEQRNKLTAAQKELEKQIKDTSDISASLTAKLSRLEGDLENGRSAAESLKKELPFDSITKAKNSIAESRERAQKLSDNIDSAQNSLNKAKEELVLIEGKTAQLQKQLYGTETSETDTNKLTKERDSLIEENDLASDKIIDLSTRIKNNSKLLTSITECEKMRAKEQSDYETAELLSRTVSGNLIGKEKLSLETFVQLRYFDAVIANANVRLKKMTNGQYELMRRREAETQRGSFGLDLDIIDFYCEAPEKRSRDVNSISGGEKFKVALSLALGLSDEIMRRAGAIRFDTLFVDEGFGSLDNDSLTLALDVLDELSASDERLIGIISHVDMLKERLDKQIVVKKSRTLGSTAKIVIN